MNKKDIFIGFLIGILTSVIGSFLFIKLFTDFDVSTSLKIIRENGYLGKVITLGTILNLAVFSILLKNNKDTMAKGVILAVIILAISTLFI